MEKEKIQAVEKRKLQNKRSKADFGKNKKPKREFIKSKRFKKN